MGSSSSSSPDDSSVDSAVDIFASYSNAAGYLARLSEPARISGGDSLEEIKYRAYRTQAWERDFQRLSQLAENGKMAIFVKGLTGTTKTLDVQPSMDIMMVKTLVRQTWGIPEHQQRLVCAGKQLEHDRTIADSKIAHESTLHLMLRTVGGGYPHGVLEKWLSEEERKAVKDVFGYVQEYDVIPEDASLHRELYPKLKTFHFVLKEPFPPRILDAIARYTGNAEFARFNCLLNLLNRVADETLFNDLMRVCLGSFQANLPDRVFRHCEMNSREMAFYSQSLGKKVILKGFLSTSIEHQQNFGGTVIEINLIRGRRNGAFFIGSLSQFPNEKEVLLCAYSTYLVRECRPRYLLLDYYDYYQYDN